MRQPERRKNPRVKTHIATKMSNNREMHQLYGYIENLSESGMGIVAMENLVPGMRYSCNFFLDDLAEKLSSVATLIYTRNETGMINYYGFRFDYLSEKERAMIQEYVGSEMKLTQRPSLKDYSKMWTD